MKRAIIPWPVLFVLVSMVFLNACDRSRTESPMVSVDKLFATWNRTDSPGCAVGVSYNGAIVLERGYGMANIERSVPITPETVFSVASISKAFTAMSVLLAADHGQWSLDDEVQKFIPEWVDRDDHITIRHLLTHTSGLRDAFTLLGWAPPSESAGDQNEAILRILSRQRGLNFPPGTRFEYNNGGYNLLASALKRATGQSLRAFADANVFKPLGMTRSYLQDDPTRLVPNGVTGYQRHVDGWRDVSAAEARGAVGNGGMQSTVGDLLRWAQNFDDMRVGTPQMLAAIQKPIVLPEGGTSSYGVGLGEYRGAPIVQSSGGGPGVASRILRFPGHRFAVAVLCNEDNIVMGGMARVNPDVLTNGVADIYLAGALSPVEVSHTPGPQPPTPVTVSDDELREKSGLYRLVSQDWPFLISPGRGVLLSRSYYEEDNDFELTPVGANRFLVNGMVLVEFVPSTAGKPREWRVGPEGKDQGVLLPVTFVTPASELPSYTGDYHSDEIVVTFTVERRGSGLALKNHGWVDTPVQGYSKDVFVGDVVGIVKFSRDARGEVTGFTVNREGARGVRFDRMKRR
jgi:CubicO group peptidase (beta-lactamase class C family)